MSATSVRLSSAILQPNYLQYHIRKDDLQRLYAGCFTPQDRAIVDFPGYTDLTIGQVSGLYWSAIDLDAGCVVVHGYRGVGHQLVELNSVVFVSIQQLFEIREREDMPPAVFQDEDGNRLQRGELRQRLKLIGIAAEAKMTVRMLMRMRGWD